MPASSAPRERLLADIDAGKIDAGVVYKVDRLSRSLLDVANSHVAAGIGRPARVRWLETDFKFTRRPS